jgi:hypothetical protein
LISYKWYLSPDQPFNKEELFKLQYCLHAAGILLDLSWDKGSPVMSISVPEGLMEKADEQPPADVPPFSLLKTGLQKGKDLAAAGKEAGPQRPLKTT